MSLCIQDVDVLPDSTATLGEDFQLPATIVFPEGVTLITIPLELLNNDIPESLEVVDFRFYGDKFDNDVTIRVEISDDDVEEPETDESGGNDEHF